MRDHQATVRKCCGFCAGEGVAVSDSAVLKKRLGYYRYCKQHGEPWRIDLRCVEAAAEFFSLDLDKENHCEELLLILADALFGVRKGRPRGTNSAWPWMRRCTLANNYELMKMQHPGLSNAGIAKRLCRLDQYRKYDPDTLRRRMLAVHREFRESTWFDQLVELERQSLARHYAKMKMPGATLVGVGMKKKSPTFNH